MNPMKNLRVAGLVLAVCSAAAPASALVWAITNNSDQTITATVHNATCDNKTRVLAATNSYGQMDWRGGCTDSCAYNVYLRWTNANGVSYCTHYFVDPKNLGRACNTQHVRIWGKAPYILMDGFKGTWDSEDCM